jgi:hypothetical protein
VWRVKPRFFYVYHISHFCVHNLAKLHRIRCKIWTSLSYLRSLLQTFIFYQLSVQSKRSGLSLQAKRFFVFFVEPIRRRMGELLQAKQAKLFTLQAKCFCWTGPRKNGWTATSKRFYKHNVFLLNRSAEEWVNRTAIFCLNRPNRRYNVRYYGALKLFFHRIPIWIFF